jgi:uncharacterized protein
MPSGSCRVARLEARAAAVMDLRREEIPNGPVITGFSGRGFRVGERIFAHGVLIDPAGVADWTAPDDIAGLDMSMLGGLLDIDPPPEFLLLGTGAQLVQPPRSFARDLEQRGIGIEAMDSRAAARAWGVLRLEQRRIVGAFFPL